ncbi:MAG: OB-fold nucleic acid binding domain-containing protein, partial [Planctomycetota bacterium]
MSRINIKSIEQQQTISQVFQLADVQLRANRQGGKYLLMKLSDRTGVITAMRWNAEDQDIEGLKKGGFVFCEGRAQLYNNAMQLIVTATRPVAASEVDLEDFERFDSETASANLDSIRDIFDSFRNVPLRRLGALFLEDEDFVDDLSHAAAAVSHHHAYPGGLLQHTLDMMNLGKMLSPRYPGVDGEVVQFGAFLHDLGK